MGRFVRPTAPGPRHLAARLVLAQGCPPGDSFGAPRRRPSLARILTIPIILHPHSAPTGQTMSSASAPSPRPNPSPPGSSLVDSLRALGFRPTCGQIAGFAGAVIFGMVLARALPFVFPVFYPLLDLVFNKILHTAPDPFNTAVMTCFTFLGSAGVAFLTTLLFGAKRKDGS